MKQKRKAWAPRVHVTGLMNSAPQVHIPKNLRRKGHRNDWRKKMSHDL